MESPSLEVFKEQQNVTLSALVWLTRWGLIKSWDSRTLEVFPSLNESVVLRKGRKLPDSYQLVGIGKFFAKKRDSASV